MAKPGFFFNVNDWLTSIDIQTMTPTEEGAYIHLLSYEWQSDDCCLPDDDEILAQLSRLGDDWFNGSGEKIKKCFVKKKNKIFNKRLYQEYKKYLIFIKSKSDAGKISGKVRRNKRLRNKQVLNTCSTDVERMYEQNVNKNELTSNKKQVTSNNQNTYSLTSDEVRLSELLFSKIKDRDTKAKQPDIQKWALHIDRLIRLDNRTPQEIEEIIIASQGDSFWQSNILSTKKLREKFSQLVQKFKPNQLEDKYAGIY